MDKFELVVSNDDDGKRLDVFLVCFFSDNHELKNFCSRSKIQALIRDGSVLVNEKQVKPSFILSLNDKIKIYVDNLPILDQDIITPYEFSVDIIYEDNDLLVVNKPKGLSVHPGAGNKNKTLLNAIINKISFSDGSNLSIDPLRVGIVHRIDKDTTGLLVVAKNEFAMTNLMKQFKEHSVDRKYVALVLSTPRGDREVNKEEEGIVDTYIGRHLTNRKKMTVLREGEGKRAITHYKKLEEYPYGCLMEFKLETGRTHQIRVHMEYINSPIIGDKLYGDFSLLPKELKVAAQKLGRQALHAKTLAFTHPVTGKRLSFDSEIPDDMKEIIKIFKNKK